MTWQKRAACRLDPDMWFDGAARADAVHVCRRHCPVLAECKEWADSVETVGGVFGGIAYSQTGIPVHSWTNGRNVRVCRSGCSMYRKEE